jgi:hypothetical protein
LSTPSASPNLKIVVMMILRVSCAAALQLRARLGLHQVGDVGGVEGGADLRVQVDAVDHDEHGGVAQRGLQRSFCAAKTISSDLPEPWKCQISPLRGLRRPALAAR